MLTGQRRRALRVQLKFAISQRMRFGFRARVPLGGFESNSFMGNSVLRPGRFQAASAFKVNGRTTGKPLDFLRRFRILSAHLWCAQVAPSSRGLGHQILNLGTRVRIPLGPPLSNANARKGFCNHTAALREHATGRNIPVRIPGHRFGGAVSGRLERELESKCNHTRQLRRAEELWHPSTKSASVRRCVCGVAAVFARTL